MTDLRDLSERRCAARIAALEDRLAAVEQSVGVRLDDLAARLCSSSAWPWGSALSP